MHCVTKLTQITTGGVVYIRLPIVIRPKFYFLVDSEDFKLLLLKQETDLAPEWSWLVLNHHRKRASNSRDHQSRVAITKLTQVHTTHFLQFLSLTSVSSSERTQMQAALLLNPSSS